MAVHLTSPADLARLIGDPAVRSGHRVLVRQYGRVLSAFSVDLDDDGVALSVYGDVVFGGPPAPDVGDDITTWYLTGDVEVITPEELEQMRKAKEADEAARPVYELGEQGQLVVAPDGSTILAAEDMPLGAGVVEPGLLSPSPTVDRGVRLEKGDIYIPLDPEKRARVSHMIRDLVNLSATTVGAEDAPSAPAPTVRDQLPSRRRTLARFARDYAKAWEDDEDPDLLGMLENNLQVSVRRVMEVTDP